MSSMLRFRVSISLFSLTRLSSLFFTSVLLACSFFSCSLMFFLTCDRWSCSPRISFVL